ncbi:MAG: HD domain-containing phosphohydrolase, partial [Cellulosilyticaceae bacterium]
HKRSKAKLERMQRVWQIGTKFNKDINFNRLVHKIIESAKEELQAETSFLYLIDKDRQELYSEVAIGPKGNYDHKEIIKIGEGIAGYVALKGVVLNIKDIKKHMQFDAERLIAERIGIKEKAILTIPVSSEGEVIGVLQFINKAQGGVFSKDEEKLMELLVEMQVVNSLQKARMYQQLKITLVDSIKTLATAIDAKDKYTIGHCQRVAQYAKWIGKDLGMEYEEIEDLEFAAILHDVGKIGISDAILNKADHLTDEEYELIKTHPVLGAAILQEITTLKRNIVEGAKYHHERYDGTGYCEGLKGEEIPLFARIIAIADAYDAMVGERIYREGYSVERAIRELKIGAQKQFDPKLVEVFIQRLEKNAFVE